MSEQRLESVSVFLPSLEVGGAERASVNLCNALASRGIPVELVLVEATGPFLADVDRSVTIVDLRSRHVLSALLGLRRYLRRRRPEVMLSELSHANVIAVWAAELARVETLVVVTEHVNPKFFFSQERSVRHWFLERLMRSTHRRADGVVAVSEGVRRDLARFLHIAPEAIDVAYNPIVTNELLHAKHEAPHPWLDDNGAQVVVAVGRLARQKDYPTLIRAFALVRAEQPARLLILGEGSERAALEALVAELELDEDVAMPGNVGNPASSIARAAAFVLSSRFEGLPSVLIEALPFGVPVVATDCPSGPREILAEGRHGCLVPVGDAAALADAIVEALSGRIDPPGVDAWAPYTVESATDRYVSILDAIAARAQT